MSQTNSPSDDIVPVISAEPLTDDATEGDTATRWHLNMPTKRVDVNTDQQIQNSLVRIATNPLYATPDDGRSGRQEHAYAQLQKGETEVT